MFEHIIKAYQKKWPKIEKVFNKYVDEQKRIGEALPDEPDEYIIGKFTSGNINFYLFCTIFSADWGEPNYFISFRFNESINDIKNQMLELREFDNDENLFGFDLDAQYNVEDEDFTISDELLENVQLLDKILMILLTLYAQKYNCNSGIKDEDIIASLI